MGGSRVGTGGPDPLKKSQKYRVSQQYWSGSPKNHIATKPAFNGEPLTRQQNAISKAFRWWADGGPFLVAFRSSLTTPSDKMFWIRACMQCVWIGSIEIKLSTDIISWYFGTYNVRQRLRRDCASLHSQFSIDSSGMSSITAFMLNGLILCLTSQTTIWKKALLYISLYKQHNLANLFSSLNLRFACLFFKVITSTVTCKCSISTTRQRMA